MHAAAVRTKVRKTACSCNHGVPHGKRADRTAPASIKNTAAPTNQHAFMRRDDVPLRTEKAAKSEEEKRETGYSARQGAQ